ncbi:right-handed parallel beta-helix repeat-containing protein [Arthrobacter sp. ERGS1:01]|uniref:right-handed parallel beta-helix repeat-containing protein n=1 Tax=Arthrobacter sp. ERGS1:01 TaxID=1704044 RepID=UPI0006B5A15D|nr:right-handed parallel beta-helix repeat-containing protein [Arthrobacter sp. ERGS1:01]
MDTITASKSITSPWTSHERLSAGELGPDTVGYHAATRTAQDPAPLPVHATDRTVVRVTDFGADPSGAADSAYAVYDAIVHARGLGTPATIEFPHGRYTLYPEDAPKRELYVSNTVGRFEEFKVKNIGILLEDMHDVIVEGNGSELTFHGRATQFAAIRSSDVTIRNFSTDWHAPLVLDLTVLASGVEDGFGFRDIKLLAGVGHVIDGATATFTGEPSPATGVPSWSHGPEVATEWQNQIRELASGLTLRSPLPLWIGSRSVTDLGNNVLRVRYDSAGDPGDAGKVYELRQRPRDTPGGFVWESERVELKNLALGYLHGFGIVGQLSRDLSLDGITLRAKPGTWRQTAGLADFIQLSGVAGKAQITNCLFDNPHDDPINIHGTYVQVEAIDRDTRTVTLKYMERDTAGFPQFYPGDELRFVRRATMLSDGAEDYRVVAVTGPNGRDTAHDLERMTATVDKELPADLAVGSYVAENMTYTPEVYIAGNTFKSTPTRGILVTTPKPVLIERNHFDQMGMASIYISADADYWYESSGVTNATIRNNVFDRPASGWAAIWFDPTNAESEPARTVHGNIRIDANRFMLPAGGSLVRGKSVAGLSFTNNHVGHYAPTVETPAHPTPELFDFAASRGLVFSGNRYAPGFNVAVAISEMAAGEVDGAADGVETRTVSVAADADQSVVGTPDGHRRGTLLAPLGDPVWTGVDFGEPASPLAWLTHAPTGTTQVSVALAAAEPGTSLHLNYNDRKVATTADGNYVLDLLAGPNILEVRTLGADRSAGQCYRWVMIAD